MIPVGKYLIEVSLCTAFVFLIYTLLLKNKTFFQANRLYLLAGLIASLVLPLISLPHHVTKTAPAVSKISLEKIETEYIPFVFTEGEVSTSFDFSNVKSILYLCGVCFFTFKFLSGIWNVFQLKKQSAKKRIHNTDIYIQESFPAFSFFKMIFASAKVHPLVIKHEKVHIDQLHWVDNLFVEIIGIALWFNPVMIYYKRAIKNQHEFLADEGALIGEEDASLYMRCLLNTTYSQYGLTITSHFGSNTIKNRIMMLTKNKTPLRHAMLYFLALPAIALLLFAFQDSSLPKAVATQSQPEYILATQSTPSGAPIETGKIRLTFNFGEKLNPVTNKLQNHTGMDFVTEPGENVLATADGIVIDAKFDEIKGNYVVIKHSDQFVTQYFHMKALTVKPGVRITQGEVIGFVGSTGLSVKDHLHYEVLKDGKAVNPIKYLPKEFKGGC